MNRWFWKRWVWAVLVGTTAAVGLTVAQPRGSDAPPSPPKVGDVISLKFRDGPDRQVKVIKSEKQPDGSYLSEVRDAKTGETFTLVDRPGDSPTNPGAGAPVGGAGKTTPRSADVPKAKERTNDPLLPPLRNAFPDQAKDKRGGQLIPAIGKPTATADPPAAPEERPGLLKRLFGRNKTSTPRPTGTTPPTTTTPPVAKPATPDFGAAMHPSTRPVPGATTAQPLRATNEPPRTGTLRPVTPPAPAVSAPVKIPTAPPAPPAVAPAKPSPVAPPPAAVKPTTPEAPPARITPSVPSTPIVPPPAPDKPVTPAVPPVSVPLVPPVSSAPVVPPTSSVPALPAVPSVPSAPVTVPATPPAPAPVELPPIPTPPGGVSAAPGAQVQPASLVATAAVVPAGQTVVIPGDHNTPHGRAMMQDIRPHVVALQTGGFPSERALAARALAGGRHGSTDAVKAVLFQAAQADPAGIVRSVCIGELSKLGYYDPGFVAYLNKACDDPSADVKAAAKDALAKMAPRR